MSITHGFTVTISLPLWKIHAPRLQLPSCPAGITGINKYFFANFSILKGTKDKEATQNIYNTGCVVRINVSHLLSLSYCVHKNLGTCSEAQTSWDHHDNKYNSRQTHRTTYLIGMPATRKEVAIVVAMKRDVQDTGVLIEGLLSAVAVVNVLERDGKKGDELAYLFKTMKWSQIPKRRKKKTKTVCLFSNWCINKTYNPKWFESLVVISERVICQRAHCV